MYRWLTLFAFHLRLLAWTAGMSVAGAVWADTPWEGTIPVHATVPDHSAIGLVSTALIATPIGAIADLNVTLHLANGWNGDLYAYLVHDSGFVVLLNRPGRTSSQPWGYGDSGMHVTLDDQAANGDLHVYRVTLSGPPGTPLGGPLGGIWAPDGRTANPLAVLDTDSRGTTLSSFNGLNPNGEWVLFVADLASGDVVTLESWELEIHGSLGIAPTITSQPPDQTIECASDAVLSVAAAGTGPMSYQWQYVGQPITGATGATLTVPSAGAAETGAYAVIVSNAFGTVTSQVATLMVLDTMEPTITCAPDRVIEPGAGWGFDSPTAADTCGPVSIQVQSTMTNAAPDGDLVAVRTWLAVDGSANQAACSQSIRFSPPVRISGTVRYFVGSQVVPGTAIDVTGDAAQRITTGADGRYSFEVNRGGTYTVTPAQTAESALGWRVDTLDMIVIRRHLLAYETFTLPCRFIAADVNGTKGIDTLDMIRIRRLVLGLDSSFAAGQWNYVRSDFVFTNTSKPWFFDGHRDYAGLTADASDQDFLAIKIGDASGNWAPKPSPPALAPSAGPEDAILATPTARFFIDERRVAHGQVVAVPVAVGGFQDVNGFQFTAVWDPAVLEFVSVKRFGAPGLDAGSFNAQTAGKLAVCWMEPQGQSASLKDDTVLFEIELRAIGAEGRATAISFADSPTTRGLFVGLAQAAANWIDGQVAVLSDTLGLQPGACRILIEAGGAVYLGFGGTPGRRYTIQCSESLNDLKWLTLGSATVGALGLGDYLDTRPPAFPCRFYRLVEP